MSAPMLEQWPGSKPEPRIGADGRFTTTSLRDHYRWQISRMDGMDRVLYAYTVLNCLLSAPTGSRWTKAQMKAIAVGLELGMKEGTR